MLKVLLFSLFLSGQVMASTKGSVAQTVSNGLESAFDSSIVNYIEQSQVWAQESGGHIEGMSQLSDVKITHAQKAANGLFRITLEAKFEMQFYDYEEDLDYTADRICKATYSGSFLSDEWEEQENVSCRSVSDASVKELEEEKLNASYKVLDLGEKPVNVSVGGKIVESATVEFLTVELKVGTIYSCMDIEVDPFDDVGFEDLCDFSRYYYEREAYFELVKKKTDQGFKQAVFNIASSKKLPIVQWSDKEKKYIPEGDLQPAVLVLYRVNGKVSNAVLRATLEELASHYIL